jgi:hypothetical protein
MAAAVDVTTVDTAVMQALFEKMAAMTRKSELLRFAEHLNKALEEPLAEPLPTKESSTAAVREFVVRCQMRALRQCRVANSCTLGTRKNKPPRKGLAKTFRQRCHLTRFVAHAFTEQHLPYNIEDTLAVEKRAVCNAIEAVLRAFPRGKLVVGRASHDKSLFAGVSRRHSTTHSKNGFIGCVLLLTDVLPEVHQLDVRNRSDRLGALEKHLHAYMYMFHTARYYQTSATSSNDGRSMRDNSRYACLYAMFSDDNEEPVVAAPAPLEDHAQDNDDGEDEEAEDDGEEDDAVDEEEEEAEDDNGEEVEEEAEEDEEEDAL